MSYHQYDIEDFVNDPFFRKWIIKPDPETNFFWEKWLLTNPEKKKVIAEARAIVSMLRFEQADMTEEQRADLFKRIKEVNRQKEGQNSGEGTMRSLYREHSGQDFTVVHKKINAFNSFQYIAAAIVLLLAAALLFWQPQYQKQEKEKIVKLEKVTSRGQKSRIFLPDGSTVLLNSGSKLLYPAKFEEGYREVSLVGEAFFEVVKDSLRPFYVKTAQLTTKVLGTSFNVSAYSGKEHRVALVTGKVELTSETNNENKLVLAPGEMGRYIENSGQLKKDTYDYNKEILWKDGVLYFKDTPLMEVLNRLEQWYGVDFILKNRPGKEYPITGRFENENLSNILQNLSYAVKFDYQINNNEVQLIFNK